MTVYTTLNKIRAFEPPKSLWEKLLSSLGKTAPDDKPLALVSILESIGLDGALWCTRTVFNEHREKIVEFAIRCADNVLPIFEKKVPNDHRPRLAIQAAKDYLEGKITETDLEVGDAAYEATYATDRTQFDDVANAAYAAYAAYVAAKVDEDADETATWADRASGAAWLAKVTEADFFVVIDADATEKKFQENLFREIFG